MAGDRGFSSREIGGFLTFIALGAALGIGAYRVGNGPLAGAAGGAVITPAAATATPNGETLFTGNCAGCHGAQAAGGVGPALKDTGAWTDEQFEHAVLNGQAPTRELGAVMPRFGTVGLDGAPATAAQVKAIHAYLQTLK